MHPVFSPRVLFSSFPPHLHLLKYFSSLHQVETPLQEAFNLMLPPSIVLLLSPVSHHFLPHILYAGTLQPVSFFFHSFANAVHLPRIPTLIFISLLPIWVPWCWERLKGGGEGDDRGWDDWLVSPTQWTWVWADSRKWWRTRKPDMLQFMGSQSWTWLSDWKTTKVPFKFRTGYQASPLPGWLPRPSTLSLAAHTVESTCLCLCTYMPHFIYLYLTPTLDNVPREIAVLYIFYLWQLAASH